MASMTDLVPVRSGSGAPAPATAVLGSEAPTIEHLFTFARDAELRVQSLRMKIDEHSMNARGDDLLRHEILLRHPGMARVTSTRSDDPLSDDYRIWISVNDTIHTYDARIKLASTRPRPARVVGSDDADLPASARSRRALTGLAAGSMADTFLHPHGLLRSVLTTGPLAIVGTRSIAGREAFVVRSDHPRTSKVLVDRPDRSIEVGIDRAIGLLLFFTEYIGGEVTQHVEATSIEIDPDIPDTAFELHLSSSVRRLY
jgi:hypothetical protein